MRILKITIILTFVLFTSISYAQVKEVTFLGKNWYLHGVESRLQFPNYYYSNNPDKLMGYNEAIINEITSKYSVEFIENIPTEHNSIRITDVGCSAGLVFKPFTKSDIRFLNAAEVCHNIGFYDVKHWYTWDNIPRVEQFQYSAASKSSMFFYNPSINFSTGAFAKRIKLYAGLDLRFATENRIEFITNREAKDSIFSNHNTSPLQNTNHIISRKDFGAGYTVGLKLAATCYFNIHAEIKNFASVSAFKHSNAKYSERLAQFQIGFRYKFAGPNQGEQINDDKDGVLPVFW